MGAAYSLGSFLPAVFPLVERQVEWVDARLARHKQWVWRKVQQDVGRGTVFYADKIHDDAFIDSQAMKFIFELNDAQTLAVSHVFDPGHGNRILVAEVWAAIILGARMPAKAKIDRLCAVVSPPTASQQHLNLVELTMLLRVATRAFARLKGREVVPETVLEDVLLSFRMAYGYGDEDMNQEVSLEHVRAFAAADERCRTYLQNLAATVEVKDADNLIDQRTQLQIQMLDLATRIEDVAATGEAEAKKRDLFIAERKGDADILAMPQSGRSLEAAGAFFENQATQLSLAEQPGAELGHGLTYTQIRRSEGGLHDPFRASKKKQQFAAIGIADASVLEDQCSGWWSNISTGDDRTASLNVEAVAELFESVGIVLRTEEAQECLNSIRPNQVNRYALQDVVAWWVKRPYLAAAASDLPRWRLLGQSIARTLRQGRDWAQECLKKLRTQQRTLLGSNRKRPKGAHKGGTLGDDTLQQQGSAYLASWQRARSHLPPSKWILLTTFGADGLQLRDRDAPLMVDLELSCFPKEQNPAPHLPSWHVSVLSDLNAGRLLEKYQAGSVVWIVISTEGNDDAQLRLVGNAVKDMFMSVPWGAREHVYHTAQCEIVTVGEAKTPHAVIMLLHPTDYLHALESALPPGVFLTRLLRSVRVKLSLSKNLQELQQDSLKFADFARRLFGVQEAELEARELHPTAFQQARTQRKEQLMQQVRNLSTIPTDVVMTELRSRGYQSAGSRPELESRLRDVLLNEVARVEACAEISSFGRAVVKQIFKQFDEDRDGGLSFHELNALLDCFGLPVIYDPEDYRAMLQETGFSTTNQGFLDENGLVAYYEAHGQLAKDAAVLGLGSLSKVLSGKLEVNCSYDAEAVWALKNLFLTHTVSMASSKLYHAFLTLARHCSLTLHSSSLKTLLQDMSGVFGFDLPNEWATQPGWFAYWVDSITERLANGTQGILPEMRASVTRQLHKVYSNYSKSDWSGHSTEEHSNQPPSPPPIQNDRHLREQIDAVLDSLIELNRVLRARLTTAKQKEFAIEAKRENELKLREMCDSVERLVHTCAAHVLKVYDGARRASATISAIGFGTAELSCRCLVSGLQLTELLPAGLGEPNRREQAKLDRANRAKARRQAAIEELERQRMLQLQTEAEQARLLKEREEKLKRQQAQEERALYAKAERACSKATSDSDISQRTAAVALWDRLHEIVQQRYPQTLKAFIVCNNYAVAAANLLPDVHSEMTKISHLIKDAADEAMHALVHSGSSNQSHDAQGAQSDDRLLTRTIFVHIISSYISIQRRLGATEHVVEAIRFLNSMLSPLGAEEQEVIERAVTALGMRVLLFEPVLSGLAAALKWLHDLENPDDSASANKSVVHLRRKAIQVDEVEHSAGLEGLFLLDIGEAADAKAEFLRRKAIDRRQTTHHKRKVLHEMVRDATIVDHFAEMAKAAGDHSPNR